MKLNAGTGIIGSHTQMKKLFLTSFVFDTGDLKDIKEYRMVVVTGKEVAQPGRSYYDLAYEKAGKWFKEKTSMIF